MLILFLVLIGLAVILSVGALSLYFILVLGLGLNIGLSNCLMIAIGYVILGVLQSLIRVKKEVL